MQCIHIGHTTPVKLLDHLYCSKSEDKYPTIDTQTDHGYIITISYHTA